MLFTNAFLLGRKTTVSRSIDAVRCVYSYIGCVKSIEKKIMVQIHRRASERASERKKKGNNETLREITSIGLSYMEKLLQNGSHQNKFNYNNKV